MKIAYISNKPVFPIVDGGCAAMASIFHILNDVGSVKHLTIATHKHPFSKSAYPTGTVFGIESGAVEIDTRINPLGALSALIAGKNYNLRRFETTELRNRITSFITEYQPDIVVLESLFLSGYVETIRKISGAKVFLRSHNVEHEIWQQQAVQATGWKKKYLQSLSKSLKRVEIQRLNTVDEIWTITNEDANAFKKLGVTTPIETIPFAIDPKMDQAKTPSGSFFHLGSMNWQPNIEAVDLLIHTIWPKLNKGPELFIAGSFSEKMDCQKPSIHIVGKVQDSDAFMQKSGTLVSPIISGSGVRIKILEALANGAPVITTKLGASGIDIEESGVQVVPVADFHSIIDTVFTSPELRANLSAKALAYIRKEHSFAVVTKKIQQRIGR